LVGTTTDTTGGVLVAAGNTLLGVADQTNLPVVSGAVGQVGQTVAGLGQNLGENGVGGIPIAGGVLAGAVGTADSTVGGLANVTVGDLPVLTGPSGSTPLVGVNALSSNPTSGTLATVNALPAGGASQLANVSLGGTQVLGQAGQTGAVNASLNLSPGSSLPNPLGGAGPVGGVVSGAAGAAGGLVGGLTAGGAGSGATGGLTSIVGGVTGGTTGGATSGLTGLVGGITGGAGGSIGGGVTTSGGSAGGGLVGGLVGGLFH
jgi:hypothetical protein